MGSCLSCRRWTSKRKLSNPPRDGIASAIGSGSRKPHKDSEALKKDKKLQKLIEYSGAHPEEISGIGAYLLQHLNRQTIDHLAAKAKKLRFDKVIMSNATNTL